MPTDAESNLRQKERIDQIRITIDSASSAEAGCLLQNAALSPNGPLPIAAISAFCNGESFIKAYAPFLDIQELHGRYYVLPLQFKAIHQALLRGTSRRELENMRDKFSTKEKRTYSDGNIKIERRLCSPANGKKRVAKVYTFRITRNGQTYPFQVGRDKKKGIQIARQIRAQVKAGRPMVEVLREFNPKSKLLSSLSDEASETTVPTNKTTGETQQAAKKVSQKHATLLEVSKCFINNAQLLDIKKSSASGYACQVRKILSTGVAALKGKSKIPKEKLLALPISQLDAEVFRLFKEVMLEAAENEEQLMRAKNNINSALRQAKSMFTKKALELYKRHGLQVPYPKDFMAESALKGAKKKYRFPNLPIIENLFAELPSLISKNQNHYLARLLGLYAGLRPKEVQYLLKSQIRYNGYWYIAIEITPYFSPKHYHVRDVPIPENFAKHLLNVSKNNVSEFVISGNSNFRKNKFYREINPYLRENFFKGVDMPSHELRKLFASVVAKKHNRDTAQDWLGHEEEKTTKDSYIDKRTPLKLVEFWEQQAVALFGGPAFAKKV